MQDATGFQTSQPEERCHEKCACEGCSIAASTVEVQVQQMLPAPKPGEHAEEICRALLDLGARLAELSAKAASQ